MKSEDYKRGVRDMAAAVREACSRHAGYLPDSFSEAEQRLLADPARSYGKGVTMPTDEIRLEALETCLFYIGARASKEMIASAREELRLVLEVIAAAVRIAQRILRIHREPASCHNSEMDARAVLALHAEIEKRKCSS